MFKVTVQNYDNASAVRQQVVSVDSLPEAEILALKVVTKHYKTDNLILVHRGDLIYDVYEIFEPVGQVFIKTL